MKKADEFVTRMKKDDSFRNMVRAVQTPEERKKIIEEAGFSMTKEELTQSKNQFDMQNFGKLMENNDLRCIVCLS